MYHGIRAISFDLDNTLWDVEPVIARADAVLQEWFETRHPHITARHTIESMRATRVALARELPHLAHDMTALRREQIARHAVEAGYEASIADEACRIFLAARNDIRLYDDVLPALDRLRSRYRLATLTNGNADLVTIGLAHHFHVRLNARDIGAAKPDPRTFARLAADMGLRPEEILHVGDEPYADVDGARRSGLHTVWVDRGVFAWPQDVEPASWRVTHLGEIAARLIGER